jgi:hypothetical protein
MLAATSFRTASAYPGLGMNRAPDRLYPTVVMVLCSCRLRRAESDVASSLQDLEMEMQRREPAAR